MADDMARLCFNDAMLDGIAGAHIEGRWEDFGIGNYEYCGATGCDSDERFVVTSAGKVSVEWWEDLERPGDWPLFDSTIPKTLRFGRDSEESVNVSVPVQLETATLSRQQDGSYKWTATYLVGE